MDKKSRELVMAKLYFKNKDYKMAESSFNQYLSMVPDDVSALKLLAQVYEQTKRFDKAFEMYERCYLAEPDRTGVLLDICRLLLMNDVWLDHVDYKKWLTLAIKAFPSNPIVVNLKAFLSTLPSNDLPSSQPDMPTKTSEDVLAKILDKLSLIEARLDKMDQKLSTAQQTNHSTIEHKPTSITTPPPKPASAPVPKLGSAPASVFKPAPAPVTTLSSAPTSDAKPVPASIFSLGSALAPTTAPEPVSKPATASIFSLGSALAPTKAPEPLSKPEPSSKPAPTSVFSLGSAPTPATVPAPAPTLASSPWQTPIMFNFGGLSTGNLFAESMSRLNIPTQASFTPQNFKPQEPVENDDDNGLVPNEELPIENNCDLQEIEIKSGEEDEEVLFESRCKLYRLRDKEYKERGLGQIKILRHKENRKIRLIMRRDTIGLVCLNCIDCQKIEQVDSNRIRWVATDVSDNQPEISCFLVKFKLAETADAFMKYLKNEDAGIELATPRPDRALVENPQQPEENEYDNEVVPNEELPIENNCDLQEIEIKSGEEDEEVLFESRCKLYRLRDKEYKERGLGQIKILRHKENRKIRLIMRRDTIGLVCLNCIDCQKIEQVDSNRIKWAATDVSDSQPEISFFLVKFKLAETADAFMKYLKNEDAEIELVDPKLDQALVEKARKFQLPDLFYHKIKNQVPCEGCDGCEKDE